MALSASTYFEIQSTAAASNINAGGFNPANASMTADLTTDTNTANTAAPIVSSATYNFVAGDVGQVQPKLSGLASEVLVSQVNQHQVVVRAAGDDLESVSLQGTAEHLSVSNDLFAVLGEIFGEVFAKADGLRRDDMHQGPTLDTRNHHAVQQFGHPLGSSALGRDDTKCVVEVLAHENHAAARATHGLVGCRSDHVSMRDRAGQ